MTRQRALAVLLVLAAGSCGDPGGRESPLERLVGEVRASEDIYVASQVGNAVERHNASILVANGEAPGVIQVIDSAGRLVRNVGRKGEGPDEFGMVDDIAASGPDTVWVWDSGNARLALLNAGLDVVGTYPVPFRAQNMQGRALEHLKNHDLLLLGCWEGRSSCGVHRWAPGGLVWSFIATPADGRDLPMLAAHEADDESIWIVEFFSYRVWQLDAAGKVLKERVISREWFTEWSEQHPPQGEPSAQEAERTGSVSLWSPLAAARDIRALADRILILGTTGDPAWVDASSDGYFDVGRYSDSVIEALDPGDLSLRESVQFDIRAGMITKFLSDSEILVSETHPRLDRLSIWTLSDRFGRAAANTR